MSSPADGTSGRWRYKGFLKSRCSGLFADRVCPGADVKSESGRTLSVKGQTWDFRSRRIENKPDS